MYSRKRGKFRRHEFLNKVVDGTYEREWPVLNTKHKTVDFTIATPIVLQYRVYLPTSEKQNSRNSESSR